MDGQQMVITGAFTEFIRGFCYPFHTQPACPPNAGDPAQAMDAPFFVRQRSCALGEECVVRAVVNSTFDPATGLIMVPVPLDAIDAKPGSKIEPLTGGLYGGTIYAALGAPVSTIGEAPHDTMVVTKSFVVPSGKKK